MYNVPDNKFVVVSKGDGLVVTRGWLARKLGTGAKVENIVVAAANPPYPLGPQWLVVRFEDGDIFTGYFEDLAEVDRYLVARRRLAGAPLRWHDIDLTADWQQRFRESLKAVDQEVL